MESRYIKPAARRQPVGEGNDKLEVDAMGSAFVNPSYRHHEAVTLGAPLPFPCDGLSVSLDSTLVVKGAESLTDTNASIALKAGQIHPVAVAEVVSASGGATVTAHYFRRPPDEP